MSGLSDWRKRLERVEEQANAWLPLRGIHSRRQLLVSLGWRSLTLALAIVAIAHVTAPIWSAPAPQPLPPDGTDGTRFGLPEAQRRAVFARLANQEPVSRRIAQGRFGTQAWSVEDDRARMEKDTARTLARRHGINLSQVYLVLDEGIRKGWTGLRGQRLPATTPPLHRRRE
jgi:hypothetical protein